ncbi:MAG: 30S ribosomal protein S9 [Candidatus Gracilibacteria bacterium]
MTFSGHYYSALGKRKCAVARVNLYEKGQGRIVINGEPYKKYLTIKETYEIVQFPLKLTDHLKDVDVSALVEGGGSHAQAEAIRHGISRALISLDMLLRPTLKKAGLLTRDSRIKERKKYGLKRARRAPQFSKR